MLKAIDLSLASVCGADCIFCPHDRGERIRKKLMPFELVRKIIDEISSEEFRKEHQIEIISVGENGDAFLNKDLIEILRYIKEKLPNIKVVLSTNFQNFTKDKAKLILGEKLIDEFSCNIDGSNSQNYYNVKKMDYNRIMKNLKDFLEIRGNLNFPLAVSIISLNRYIKTIKHSFKSLPVKLEDASMENISDDSLIIEKKLKEILKPIDRIFKSWIFGWAEREKVNPNKLNYQNYSCRNLRKNKDRGLYCSRWDVVCLLFRL